MRCNGRFRIGSSPPAQEWNSGSPSSALHQSAHLCVLGNSLLFSVRAFEFARNYITRMSTLAIGNFYAKN